jgi:hypothetical protein
VVLATLIVTGMLVWPGYTVSDCGFAETVKDWPWRATLIAKRSAMQVARVMRRYDPPLFIVSPLEPENCEESRHGKL